MAELKRCKNGANCVQVDKYPDGWMPVSEFYTHYSTMKPKTICKGCENAYAKGRRAKPKNTAGNIPELAVIKRMRDYGIYTVPGKSSEFNFLDLVAWGCVRIEVKSAVLSKGRWQFGFNNQRLRGIQGDLVVLVPFDELGIAPIMYSVFPPDMPEFYHKGKLKSGVHVTPNPNRRYRGGTPLTMQHMEAYEDAWHQVEEIRERISNQLKHGIYNPKRVMKPADKPMPLFEYDDSYSNAQKEWKETGIIPHGYIPVDGQLVYILNEVKHGTR